MRIVCVQRFISQSVRSFPLSATLGVRFFWFIVSGSIYDCWGGNAYVRDLNMGGRICSSFSLALARFLTLSLSLSPAVFLSLSHTLFCECVWVCVCFKQSGGVDTPHTFRKLYVCLEHSHTQDRSACPPTKIYFCGTHTSHSPNTQTLHMHSCTHTYMHAHANTHVHACVH